MSVDYPRAWQISKMVPVDEHDPHCSYRQTDGGMLCDCHILMKHPEVLDDVLQGVDGVLFDQVKETK